VIEFEKGVGRPNLSTKFVARYQFTCPFQQHSQHVKGLILQMDFSALAMNFA